jgi:proline iminopeptidase
MSCGKEDMTTPGNLVPRTVDQDLSLPSIPINGTLLHSEAYGYPSDPMLVVIHGGPGSDYRSLMNAIALAGDRFYVVFYDQRGSGLSRRESKEQFQQKETVQLFIDDLHAVINHYRTSDKQKVFLFGHSWGAMLAAAFTNQNPEKVSGLILAEPGGLTWTQTESYLGRSNRAKLFSEALSNALYPDHLFSGSSEQEVLDYKASFFSEYENAPGNTVGNPGPYPFWRHGAVSAQEMTENARRNGFDFTANLHLYTTKVLFLYSEHNKAYGLSWAQEVSRPFPNVELAMVRAAGHEMFHYSWTQVYPYALNYLNSLR